MVQLILINLYNMEYGILYDISKACGLDPRSGKIFKIKHLLMMQGIIGLNEKLSIRIWKEIYIIDKKRGLMSIFFQGI